MDRKIALVAFNGEAMCFIHVLLNALEMEEKGFDVKVVIEGSATKLLDELDHEDHPFGKLYKAVREKGLIDCVCRACSSKMWTLEAAEAQGLPLCEEMQGHPKLSKYIEAGYEVITF